MKFRISPAAAAVFLAAGLFTSGLRAASAPAAIPFENDAAFNVTLSNTNPSKVVVDGELITSISGPTGAYDQSQTEDGALILSPLVGQNFTLFIQTDHGSSLSLNVRPQPGNGKTLRFTPISPPLRKNDDAKAWEEGQTYEKTLVALSRAVVNGQVPDDYREYRTVRRHRGAFITITQGIKDFSASKEAEAAWNNSSTKITLLQDAKAFKQYLADNPDQFSDMEKEVIRGFQPALQTGYSSLLINAGEYSSFHRLFVDPVTRAMFSSRGEDFAFMQKAQKEAGATAEEAAYMLAEKKYGSELRELEEWVKAA